MRKILLCKSRILSIVICLALVLTGCSDNANNTNNTNNTSTANNAIDMSSPLVTDGDLETLYPVSDATSAVSPQVSDDSPYSSKSKSSKSKSKKNSQKSNGLDITTARLSDNGIKIKGSGAVAKGSILTISQAGVYEVSGTLSNGQIIVNAPDKAVVELVLAGANISNSKNAAIYCKNCDDFIVTLKKNTKNVLSDAKSYTYEDKVNQEPNATLFSKSDMNIGGSGQLIVRANFNHGISSKDDLVIKDGEFYVTSAVDAIRGKDSLVIQKGKFELNAGGDGLQASSVDGAKFGYAKISGGEYTIKSGGDAIQAETELTISGGSYDITTKGTPAGDSDSQKGLKAGKKLTVKNGTFRIISKDDAIHSDNDAKIKGGTFHIETNDDGIHADRNLYINGGTINIPKCNEGFEGTIIRVNGGKSFIKASDDAISAAAGTPEAEKGEGSKNGNKYVYAVFKGGEVEAVSGGDTVDSNGNIYVKGGTLRLSSPYEPSYEGSLLCNGDVTISGGNMAVAGCMGVNVYCKQQPVLWVSHVKKLPKGTELSLRDKNGKVLLKLKTRKAATQTAYTSAKLKAGSTYALYINGEKKVEATLKSGMNTIGDDGGEFTGGYHRGTW